MTAYYNEIDPKAAAWLEELIRCGLIAPGDVDTRSIEDVVPYELRGYAQCHFFAGIGVWSHALRLAGWSDDRPVWTGSCPCQPFSAAGKGAGTSDERHLWPAWEHLVRELAPPVLIGEQVASKAADPWADLVQDDLEALDYAFGAVPFPAASVGAPHIRDRLYWVAVHESEQRQRYGDARRGFGRSADGGGTERLAHFARSGRREERAISGRIAAGVRAKGLATGSVSSSNGGLANDDDAGCLEHAQRDGEPLTGCEAAARGDDAGGCGGHGDVAHSSSTGLEVEREQQARGQRAAAERSSPASFWDACEFVWCRDGKWRPIEPLAQQMVDGIALVLGRLRSGCEAEEFKEALDAAAADPYADEALRALRVADAPETVWQKIGGQIGFPAATILLTILLEQQGKLGRVFDRTTQGSAEACKIALRSLQQSRTASCASQRREHPQQPSGQLANALSTLSQTRALAALVDRNGFPLVKGATNRVMRLRGYGNAIVAAQAALWIEEAMTVLNER